MGMLLDKPVVKKEIDVVESERKKMKAVHCSMQGFRISMEDAVSVVPEIPGMDDHAFFGVFDGHNGTFVSNFAAENVLNVLVKSLKNLKEGDDMEHIIKNSIIQFDEDMRKKETNAGSTLNAMLVTPTDHYCINVGDSRSVLSRAGKAILLSSDHKPENPEESARITSCCGFVARNRVDGKLAMSRALGDYHFKQNVGTGPLKQKVISLPDIKQISRHEDDEFLIVACDGIWDVVDADDACNFVRDRLVADLSLEDISAELLDQCLKLGSTDNMSVIIIALENAPKSNSPEEIEKARQNLVRVSYTDASDDLPPSPLGKITDVVGSTEKLRELFTQMQAPQPGM
eukprot:TRINITY_DN44720_c0_g1_i1.p1 TRINITY_DN44720_c0_g1~~TRINITY_DN44720_c0_g1_i1.p1  ORF type:complete len:344 (-),score=98.49 TRINITY_DN44720_c0_g1_i1:437-1468(-)